MWVPETTKRAETFHLKSFGVIAGHVMYLRYFGPRNVFDAVDGCENGPQMSYRGVVSCGKS